MPWAQNLSSFLKVLSISSILVLLPPVWHLSWDRVRGLVSLYDGSGIEDRGNGVSTTPLTVAAGKQSAEPEAPTSEIVHSKGEALDLEKGLQRPAPLKLRPPDNHPDIPCAENSTAANPRAPSPMKPLHPTAHNPQAMLLIEPLHLKVQRRKIRVLWATYH